MSVTHAFERSRGCDVIFSGVWHALCQSVPAAPRWRCLANNQHGRGSDRHDDGNQAQRNNDDLVRVHVAALADLGLLLL